VFQYANISYTKTEMYQYLSTLTLEITSQPDLWRNSHTNRQLFTHAACRT